MKACSYQDVFQLVDDAINEKWNTEWNEKMTSLKKSNKITGRGKKIIEVESMKLLSTDSERATLA